MNRLRVTAFAFQAFWEGTQPLAANRSSAEFACSRFFAI
jgi:hypothetical protein